MNSVIKGASYVLSHAPDMVLRNGTTQTTEMIVNPDSEYLKELPKHLRSYEDVVAYLPNQIILAISLLKSFLLMPSPGMTKRLKKAKQ